MIIIQLQAWLPTLIIILTCSNLLNKTSINFEILKTLKNVACTTWTDNIPNITIKKKTYYGYVLHGLKKSAF